VSAAISIRASRLGHPRGATVLSAIDLTIARGERVALLGGNGAGKTTLLRALVGLLPVDGEVRASGLAIRKPGDAVAAGVGLVFQNPDDQLFGASVLEDVRFGPCNQGLSPDEATRRAEESLAQLGIASLAERSIETLSFGEKKRACLAGVLAMRPSVLLLDEATAGLDPAGETAFVALLASLCKERGLTLLSATHAIDLVPSLADRVLVLSDGKLVADGTPRVVFAQTGLLAHARLRAPSPPFREAAG